MIILHKQAKPIQIRFSHKRFGAALKHPIIIANSDSFYVRKEG